MVEIQHWLGAGVPKLAYDRKCVEEKCQKPEIAP